MLFNTIYVDPPWKYGAWGTPSDRPNQTKSRPIPYSTMTVEEISSLPVANLADNNCELYIWVTQRYLPEVFNVIAKWGFKYCQTITWCKAPRGLGQGGVFCPTTEFLILGRKGLMPKVRRIDSTWFLTKRPHNSHSTKPSFFRDLIENVSNPPRIELFAREQQDDWMTIGDDITGHDIETDILLLSEDIIPCAKEAT